MRPDPGLTLQEAVILGMGPDARGAARLRLAARARWLAWHQADAAGPMSELERAEFLLRRLHPTLPEASLRQVLEQLAEARVLEGWPGFRRPDPMG